MPDTPRFTVAILSYNRPDMVQTAIASVLQQEYKDYELLVVDDASKPDTIEVLKGLQDKARIVFREENGGEMVARNTALEEARGEYLAFLDSDDAWFPWTLQCVSEAIDKHNRPAMIAERLTSFLEDEELDAVQREPYSDEFFPNYLAANIWMGVSAVVVRTDLFRSVGGFVPKRLNSLDTDMMLRLGDREGVVAIRSPVTLGFRSNEGILFNTELSYGGLMHMLRSEREGVYPGGDALRMDRLKHVTRRSRNHSVMYSEAGRHGIAMQAYLMTFWWNVRRGNLKYLAGFPLMVLGRMVGILPTRKRD